MPAMPDAPGKAILQHVCSVCHPVSLVVAQKRTPDQWNDLINQMLDRGARATDDQLQQIYSYLVKYYGASGAGLDERGGGGDQGE